MKRSILTGFRALAFALSVFFLLALGDIKVRSSTDVALFIVGLAVFWVVVEKVFIMARKRRPSPPR